MSKSKLHAEILCNIFHGDLDKMKPFRNQIIQYYYTHGWVKSRVMKSELLKRRKISLMHLHFKELFIAIQ